MRELTLPVIPPLPTSVDDCITLYCHRLRDGKTPLPNIAAVLLGHMAWPNDRARRDHWMVTLEGRSVQNPSELLENITTPALKHVSREFSLRHAQWPHVADVLQMVVDMSNDTEHCDALRGGPSISKAVDLLENEKDVPTHAPLRSAWSKFRDVAHLITAAAFLAEKKVRGPASLMPARSSMRFGWRPMPPCPSRPGSTKNLVCDCDRMVKKNQSCTKIRCGESQRTRSQRSYCSQFDVSPKHRSLYWRQGVLEKNSSSK